MVEMTSKCARVQGSTPEVVWGDSALVGIVFAVDSLSDLVRNEPVVYLAGD
jgi:hypothetical protein